MRTCRMIPTEIMHFIFRFLSLFYTPSSLWSASTYFSIQIVVDSPRMRDRTQVMRSITRVRTREINIEHQFKLKSLTNYSFLYKNIEYKIFLNLANSI